MQLKDNEAQAMRHAVKVSTALAAASGTLLAGASARAAETPWLVDSALLVYAESDARVTAFEPMVSMTRDMGDQRMFNVRFTLDALTGASPNGAIPTKETRTFTRPSGGGIRTAVVDTLPLDPFRDVRGAVSAGWVQPLGESTRLNLGGSFSRETDYLSSGVSVALAQDFFGKNTTLSLGFNYEADVSKPVGGVPAALTANFSGEEERPGEATRKVKDILVGVTQVIGRRWITQLNYSRSVSSGYQNDPYKSLSVLNSNGTSTRDPSGTGNTLYLFDSRPEQRERQSLFWDHRIALRDRDVLDLSLRHYWDDWGIRAETLDVRYRLGMGSSFYLEPHYRFYTQTAADFYRPFLRAGSDVVNGVAQLEYASSDMRLGAFRGNTFGIKAGYEISRSNEISVRYEQYRQRGDAHPAMAEGIRALSGMNLFPGLTANMLLVEYSFEF